MIQQRFFRTATSGNRGQWERARGEGAHSAVDKILGAFLGAAERTAQVCDHAPAGAFSILQVARIPSRAKAHLPQR